MQSRVPVALGVLAGTALFFRARRARRAIERLGAAALETLLNAVEANDPETGAHVRRVAACSLVIADAAGFEEHRRRAVERVALFHDIGKIHEALFDIVHDGRRLSAGERRSIATHPRRGAAVLAPLTAFYPELPRGVLAHHERWDGSGYPKGLRGKRIPLEARVVSIADTFDAVSHNRRYRRGTGFTSARQVIEAGRGTQFDPDLVDLVLFPPVWSRLVHERIAPRESDARRKPRERESVPDISFRWRAESPRARGAAAAHGVD
jgi:HD-GYP domain-containing protein (c-di-GMP phosphodiesterase class II)